MRIRLPFNRLMQDRRGVAAAEFALIAPALMFLVMGVLEMSFRFRASEEASRYVHQVADLVSREENLTTDALGVIYAAAPQMMSPLDTTDNLDLDVTSVQFIGVTATPQVAWRRVAGTPVTFATTDVAGMGLQNETVIRVGIRYHYESVLSTLFGGRTMEIERTAFTRPRMDRVVTMDGSGSDGGTIEYFEAS
jgi:Flp pilus assembly protein TadG